MDDLNCLAQNKLIWLRGELRGRQLRERRLRKEFRQALTATDTDRQFLVAELVRRDEELDELAAEKQGVTCVCARDLVCVCFCHALYENVC